MKFSVIIPVYNAEKYINDSISSVLKQTYKDFEIILVNDGSTDDSASICDSLANEYPTIIKVVHQENKGQLVSRCVGAEFAKGEYCVYLDADDIIYEKCLETLSNTIIDFENPDMVVYNFEKLTPLGEKLSRPMPLKCGFVYEGESKKDIYNTLIEGSSLNSMCNKCIKRECLIGCCEKFTEYQTLRCGEDRLQVLESVTRAHRIVFIEDILYCYRLFEGSVTRNFNISYIEKFNMRLLCEAEKQYLEKWGMKVPEWQMKLEAKFLDNAMYTFCKFYENIKNRKQKNQLIKYNWISFVPEAYLKKLSENSNVSKPYKTLWKYVINEDYLKIRMFFIRRCAYKKLRDIKRKIMK